MSLRNMFLPGSVAIVGASREKSKLGNIIMRNVLDSGFEGEVYPVNKNAQTILGHKVYVNYSEIPDTPDLAIIVVPSTFVLDIMEEIGRKGTKNVVIISAGFKEMGEDGIDRELKLIEIANKYGIRVLGPNCLGFVSNKAPINATFGMLGRATGALRFISQSGAIASSIIDWAESIGLGFDMFVTLGNKADINENDMLEYWLDQEDDDFDEDLQREAGLSGYQPVAMYLESISEGRGFMKLLRRTAKRQPTFILKPGKSSGAVSAMQSHTGSIAGADAVFDCAMEQVGVIRCEGMEDLFDLCRAFSWECAPLGPEVAIVSNAGGPAVLAADFVSEFGLKLAKVTDRALNKMESQLPLAAALHNPVDVLGDALAERYEVAIRELLSEREVKSMVVILTPQVMTEIEETAKVVVKLAKEYKKPIICAFMGGMAIVEGEKILDKYKVPNFRYIERALWALGKMWWWKNKQLLLSNKIVPLLPDPVKVDKVVDILTACKIKGYQSIPGYEANVILKKWGIDIPGMATVQEWQDVENFVQMNGFPIVMKLSSSQLLHKLEEGGVILNIINMEQLKVAYEQMEGRVTMRHLHGDADCQMMLQRQVGSGLEVIVGLKRDPVFGSVMVFGAGGTWAEVLGDRNLFVLPISRVEAEVLVKRSKIYRMLAGYRSDKPYDLDKLYDLMVSLSQLMESDERISDLEINPVIVGFHEVWAVDGKMVLKN